MRRMLLLSGLLLYCLILPLQVHAERLLVPAGTLIGLELQDGTVSIADFDSANCAAAQRAGLRVGDRLIRINDTDITCAADVSQALCSSTGAVQITYSRGSKLATTSLSIQPSQKLGLYLQQGITGVGTVTWFDPQSGQFGTLGHGVSNRQGMLLQMLRGSAYHANVTGLSKGRAGQPGQLHGQAVSEAPAGILSKNTPQGVFGHLHESLPGQAMPTADSSQIHTGRASIRSTISGNSPQDYAVEILKIDPGSTDGRNLLLKVTDTNLLSATGGIIQGMSGSPILQDGRLIGAVTHVCVTSMMPTISVSLDKDQFRSHQTCLCGILFSSAPL